MGHPAVSVVIPTYNRPEKLSRAIHSITEQTFEDWELIVVNDHPEVDVRDVLPDTPRVHYIQHEENQGAPVARNNGIEAAEGRFVAFLDDDDAWKPRKLDRQIDRFETLDESYGVVYTGRDKIRDGKVVRRNLPEDEGWIVEKLLERNVIPSETPLVRRSCFQDVGGFDPAFESLQDLDLWVRIANEYKFSVIPESLAISYVGHDDRISQDLERKYRGHKRFVTKHRELFASNPHALASHQRQLGVYASMTGRRWEGCRNLIASYKREPSNWGILLEIVMCLSPRRLRDVIFDLRTSMHARRTESTQ